MKIEKVSENIIKVTISRNDLEERQLDLSSMNYNSPAAQGLFLDMMEQAEMQFGFNVSDSQLIIEPVYDSGDGFVITITRLGDDADFESIHKYIKSRFRKTDIRVKKKSRKILSTLAIYTFESFEDLCCLCRQIEPLYSGESSLFLCKDTYYLVLTRSNTGSQDTRLIDTLLGEYGKKVRNAGFLEGYLNEYGTKIAEHNAISTINSYF